MIPSGVVLLTVGACLLEQTLLVSIDWENSKIGFYMFQKIKRRSPHEQLWFILIMLL